MAPAFERLVHRRSLSNRNRRQDPQMAAEGDFQPRLGRQRARGRAGRRNLQRVLRAVVRPGAPFQEEAQMAAEVSVNRRLGADRP